MKNVCSEPALKESVLEDIVQDFLEMACFLKPAEQRFLINELLKESLNAESIEVYPCFSINGRAVIICEENSVEECWMYFVHKGHIEKWSKQKL